MDDKDDDDNIVIQGAWAILDKDSPLNDLLSNKVIEHLKDTAENNVSRMVPVEEETHRTAIAGWMQQWATMLGEGNNTASPVYMSLDEDMTNRITSACREVDKAISSSPHPVDVDYICKAIAKKLHERTGFCWKVTPDGTGEYNLDAILHYGDNLTMTSPTIH